MKYQIHPPNLFHIRLFILQFYFSLHCLFTSSNSSIISCAGGGVNKLTTTIASTPRTNAGRMFYSFLIPLFALLYRIFLLFVSIFRIYHNIFTPHITGHMSLKK